MGGDETDGRYNSTFPTARLPATMPLANQVRIIGGQWRGRRIRFPVRPGLRPTPDRVRETLFNWLGQSLDGLKTLDPYAGSGALSLEALSRGAARAVAGENDPVLIRSLDATALSLGCAGLETHVSEANQLLRRDQRLFDVIFLDPPFDSDPWDTLFPLSLARLSPEGAIYAEAARVLDPPPGLIVCRHGKAGQVHYHLLRRTPDTPC